MAANVNEEQTVRAKELSRKFNVSLQSIYNWCDTGVLQSVKVGRLRLIDKASAEALFAGCERKRTN